MHSITPQGVYPCISINFSALPEQLYIILPELGRRRVRPKNQLLFHFHHFPNLQRYDSLASISQFAGIDIGSRTIELEVLNDRKIIESKQTDSKFDPMMQAKEMLESVEHDHISYHLMRSSASKKADQLVMWSMGFLDLGSFCKFYRFFF